MKPDSEDTQKSEPSIRGGLVIQPLDADRLNQEIEQAEQQQQPLAPIQTGPSSQLGVIHSALPPEPNAKQLKDLDAAAKFSKYLAVCFRLIIIAIIVGLILFFTPIIGALGPVLGFVAAILLFQGIWIAGAVIGLLCTVNLILFIFLRFIRKLHFNTATWVYTAINLLASVAFVILAVQTIGQGIASAQKSAEIQQGSRNTFSKEVALANEINASWKEISGPEAIDMLRTCKVEDLHLSDKTPGPGSVVDTEFELLHLAYADNPERFMADSEMVKIAKSLKHPIEPSDTESGVLVSSYMLTEGKVHLVFDRDVIAQYLSPEDYDSRTGENAMLAIQYIRSRAGCKGTGSTSS